MTYAQVIFSQMIFAQVIFAQITFAQRTFAQITFAQRAFAQMTFAHRIFTQKNFLKYHLLSGNLLKWHLFSRYFSKWHFSNGIFPNNISLKNICSNGIFSNDFCTNDNSSNDICWKITFSTLLFSFFKWPIQLSHFCICYDDATMITLLCCPILQIFCSRKVLKCEEYKIFVGRGNTIVWSLLHHRSVCKSAEMWRVDFVSKTEDVSLVEI